MDNKIGSSVNSADNSKLNSLNSFGIDSFYIKDQSKGISIGSKNVATFISNEGESYKYGEIKGSREEVVEAVSWMIGVESLALKLESQDYEIVGSRIILKKSESGEEYPVLLTQNIDEEKETEHPLISIERWSKMSDQDPVKKNISYIIDGVNNLLKNSHKPFEEDRESDVPDDLVDVDREENS